LGWEALSKAACDRRRASAAPRRRLHSANILRLSEDLPIVVEIVDSQEKIDQFLPVLDRMMGCGLVTLEKVTVLQYGEGAGEKR